VRKGDELRVQAISGEETVDGKSASVKELERLLLWSATHEGVLFIDDIGSEEPDAGALRERFASYITASDARGLLVVPIADAEGELGRLLFEFGEPNVLDERMREATGILANQAALAMRNAQLYADVPFISWLEPIAQKRRALMALPAAVLLKYAVGVLVALALLILVRLPLRVGAASAVVHAAVQLPARAGAEGVIEEMLVREGDRVSAGQPIARLRNEQLLARLSETQGALRLAERQGLAAAATGNAGAAVLARVSSQQLRNSITLLEQEARSLVVKAPAAGVVLTPQLAERVGSFRLAGEPVAWIGDPNRAEVRLRIPQQDIAYIRLNDRVRVRASAIPEQRFDGNVTGIAPLAETFAGSPHYTVRAILDNESNALRPGMEARARVLTESRPLGYLIIRRPWRWIRLHLWW
jgi:multidrug resistance efflux pump